MGLTFARGSISNNSETRQYNFLVDTGATWMSIPQHEIDALRLEDTGHVAEITTPTGVLYKTIFRASGTLEGIPFDSYLVEAYRPIVGYMPLQNLGFVVDLVEERIVLRDNLLSNPS